MPVHDQPANAPTERPSGEAACIVGMKQARADRCRNVELDAVVPMRRVGDGRCSRNWPLDSAAERCSVAMVRNACGGGVGW